MKLKFHLLWQEIIPRPLPSRFHSVQMGKTKTFGTGTGMSSGKPGKNEMLHNNFLAAREATRDVQKPVNNEQAKFVLNTPL